MDISERKENWINLIQYIYDNNIVIPSMTQEQNRMEGIYKSYMDFCCKLENQHEGLTQIVYNHDMKELEHKAEQLYKDNKLTDFVMIINVMRTKWMVALNKMQQTEMKL